MCKRNFVTLSLLLTLVFGLCLGCSPQKSDQASSPATDATQQPAAPAPSSPASDVLSETAAKTEARLGAAEEAEPDRTLPPDHWLVGTSDEKDMFPAVIAPDAPRKLLAEHGPAYLEQIGAARVLHLKGSYYDMGVQHGTLLKDEIVAAAKQIKIIGTLAWKEKDYSITVREAWERTNPFIPQAFKEEIRGMAEAAGLTDEEVQDFTIFPELFHCSGFALWGKATADGALLHGRVLDYMRDAGLDKYALIIIQEPEGANAFVNVGYSGMIGSVTGMSVNHIAIGEMGGKGEGQWDGMPMTILLRLCLEQAKTLDDVRRIMSETPRTCQYYYCVSDSKADDGRGSAFGVAAEPDTITFIEPNEPHELLPRPFEDSVLMSAGHRYMCLADRVEKMYGRITPQIALDMMARGVAMRSNMHDALFKPATLELWVANSTVEQPACNLPYTHYDLDALMTERPAP